MSSAADVGLGGDDQSQPAYARSADAVLTDVGSDAERGLTEAEVLRRLSTYGPNEISGEKPPPSWRWPSGSCATR